MSIFYLLSHQSCISNLIWNSFNFLVKYCWLLNWLDMFTFFLTFCKRWISKYGVCLAWSAPCYSPLIMYEVIEVNNDMGLRTLTTLFWNTQLVPSSLVLLICIFRYTYCIWVTLYKMVSTLGVSYPGQYECQCQPFWTF